MPIRNAEIADKENIVSLYRRSQEATGLPDPNFIPPSELGARLYARHALGRYVYTHDDEIVGHGLIEVPNDSHMSRWAQGLSAPAASVIEMGGAFVDPELLGRGIWTELLLHRMRVIRSLGAVPVSATWARNQHVVRIFEKYGGSSVGNQMTEGGEVSLFVFNDV